jgi:hypothetical protein
VEGPFDLAERRLVDVLREIAGDLRAASGSALYRRKGHRSFPRTIFMSS